MRIIFCLAVLCYIKLAYANHIIAAHKALTQGDFELAITLAQDALKHAPDQGVPKVLPQPDGAPNAHHILGHCQYQLGNITGAVKEFMIAAKEQPESVTEWLNLADVLKFAKHMREAQAAMAYVVNRLGQQQYSGRLAGLQLWTAEWNNYTEHRAAAARQLVSQHTKWLSALSESEDKSPGILMRLNFAEASRILSSTSATDLHDILPRLMPWASLGPVHRSMSVNPPSTFKWPAKCGFDFHCQAREPKLGRPLRVGILSPDWSAHPVVELSHGMLEQLARSSEIELVLLTLSSEMGDLTAGLVDAASCVVSINATSVEKNRALIREQHLDIVIDMAGHTVGGGFGLLSGRVAPLQIAYLGYPATTAAPWIDFVTADVAALPADTVQMGTHTERVAYMQGSYIPASHMELHRSVALMTDLERQGWRASIVKSLPQNCSRDKIVLLGVLSGQHKIDPATMQMWIEILQAEECAFLILTSTGVHSEVESHLLLREWVEGKGIDPQRLQWLPRLPRNIHLKVKAALDMVLDSPLKSGHSSHLDAMWAGLPVVVLKGVHMHNRAPTSLCRGEAAGCVFVTDSPSEYVTTVLNLLKVDANGNRPALLATQAKLRQGLQQTATGIRDSNVWSTIDQARRLKNVLLASYRTCQYKFGSRFSFNTTAAPVMNPGRLEGLLAWGENWSGCRSVGHTFAGSRMLWRSILSAARQRHSDAQ